MIYSIASGIYNNLPNLKIDSPKNILRKAQQVALPAILLAGLTELPGASAIGCFGCVACLASGGGLLCIPVCVLCGVTIPVPLGFSESC